MPTKKRFTEDSYKREPWFKAVCQALLTVKNEDDMANMLRDIGTLSELQAWGERLEVAKHLVKGLSYRQVAATTGASTTTVTRVAKCIENGTGGYRKLLKAHRHHRLVQAHQSPPDSTVEAVPEAMESKPIPAQVDLLQKFLKR